VVNIKIMVLWNVLPCNLADRYRCFGGMYNHHIKFEITQGQSHN